MIGPQNLLEVATRVLGEFKWWSQHLKYKEGLLWEAKGSVLLIGRYGLRCIRPGDRRDGTGSIESVSGRRLHKGCKVSTPPYWSVCLLLWEIVGFDKMEECHHSLSVHYRDGTCRSTSGRRSRSFTGSIEGFVQSRGNYVAHRRQFRANYVGTQRRVAGRWSIGPRRLNGTRTVGQCVQRLRSSWRILDCTPMCRSGWRGRSQLPRGRPCLASKVRWNGRRHGPRQDRRWATSWSPEQIANRLPVDFPDDESMRISHEAIYQALYVQGRGALRRELVACLRTGRTLRVPRARRRRSGKNFVSPEIMISERPAEAEDRAVPGHWEGNLIVGLNSSAIGTLVERSSRFTILLHLPRMDGHGDKPPTKNGPALAGHGAEAVRDAIAASIATLPAQLRRSLTWDQGAEMAQHAQLRVDTADWQFISVTRAVPGSVVQMKTPMGCCASTSLKAPT